MCLYEKCPDFSLQVFHIILGPVDYPEYPSAEHTYVFKTLKCIFALTNS